MKGLVVSGTDPLRVSIVTKALLGVLVASLGATACGDQQSASRDVVVRDSSGVRIVENRTPQQGADEGLRVDLASFVEIGSEDGVDEVQFERIVDVVQSGGTFVVADGGSRTLQWFTESGDQVATAGGTGEGPGQFVGLSWIGVLPSDTVLAWDRQLRRLSVFFEGRYVRDSQPVPGAGPFTRVEGMLGDGRLVTTEGSPPMDFGPGVHRPEVRLRIVSLMGATPFEVGTFPGLAVHHRVGADSRSVIRQIVPFGPRSVFGVAADRIVVGDNATFTLRMFSDAGALESQSSVDGSPRPITPLDLERELERRMTSAPPIPEVRDGIRMNFEATEVPEVKPFFDDLVVDGDRGVWIRVEGAPDSANTTWNVVSRDGVWLSTLELPTALDVRAITRDRIAGVWTDALGIETVRIYRLERS